MTRLKSADVEHLGGELCCYHKQLQQNLGMTLAELACRAAGVAPELVPQTANFRVAAVPITSGEGVITHFSESLAAISTSLGFSAEVTKQTDIAGLAEAYQGNFDIVLTSDDDLFCAINLKQGRVIDNSIATARGFVHGLAALAGGLREKPVLVLGCGPVGLAGIEAIIELGGKVSVFDPRPERCQEAVARFAGAHIQVAATREEALGSHSLIFEATPVANTVDVASITSQTCMAAPGVPCGTTEEAAAALGSRLLWDPLQIGVATMLMAAAFAPESEHCALK
ncbi:3-methylornithyl-N6-L-lysine dehydrogenase PylD [Desulfobulbus rhabdoformis]|uniref:3-methylornithyl-N6-L-lysine dehydrogenase PylD n=1 Tax=Desulfobulbus rhabdoformis TaxID=34032 RepID=UPI0019663406|nr:3-methylornithyl-N6-L-lysine dehydrogenase PylD [Desulfobulbus rhabdoformis]MBM9615898.1 3-methylornithyl-N6-L-lysine dehydrogenase PylD [Desulfobulbus rhabdoformis]